MQSFITLCPTFPYVVIVSIFWKTSFFAFASSDLCIFSMQRLGRRTSKNASYLWLASIVVYNYNHDDNINKQKTNLKQTWLKSQNKYNLASEKSPQRYKITKFGFNNEHIIYVLSPSAFNAHEDVVVKEIVWPSSIVGTEGNTMLQTGTNALFL